MNFNKPGYPSTFDNEQEQQEQRERQELDDIRNDERQDDVSEHESPNLNEFRHQFRHRITCLIKESEKSKKCSHNVEGTEWGGCDWLCCLHGEIRGLTKLLNEWKKEGEKMQEFLNNK